MGGFSVMITNGCNPACLTFRLAGEADITSVEDEPMVRLGNQLLGQMRHQGLFGFQHVLGVLC